MPTLGSCVTDGADLWANRLKQSGGQIKISSS